MLRFRSLSPGTGALIAFLLSALVLCLLFHRHIREANEVSFASHGDGIHSNYGTLYHLQHDSSYWHFEGNNYPFGESVFFTGNQVYLTNFMKLCKEAGLDFSGKAIGILNIWMLFSFAFCALFLFLVLNELHLPTWYAILGSLLVTFLSPQWDRLGGHYNLAYAWVIPAALYMMIRFYRKPSFVVSILFGLFILVLTGKHVYFIVLVGVVWGIYWVFLLARGRELYGKTTFLIPHLFVQMLIPFLVFSLFSGQYDLSSDRTAFPWGFFPSTTRWVSVFLPLTNHYARWIIVGPTKTIGYVGFVSTLVFAATIVLFVRNWIRSGLGRAVRLSDLFILNVLFLGGLISLLISLGYPFSFHPPMLNYSGPFRQLRAVGRFMIPFYYIMNIYTLYMLWKWNNYLAKRWFAVLLTLALLWFGFEAAVMVGTKPAGYFNKFEVLNDRENGLPENWWVNNHEWSDYQAIMPLPYYHIGSENYWVNGSSPVIDDSYFASLKTGLPLNAVMSSRTSISQSLMNIDLYYEPYREYPGLENYDPEKAILLMQHRKGILSENERNILEKSTLVDSGGHLLFYRLHPDSLRSLLAEAGAWRQSRAEELGNDSVKNWFFYESYAGEEGGVLNGSVKENRIFAECTLPDSGSYLVSFWYKGAMDDLWPRTKLYIHRFDKNGTRYSYYSSDFFRETVLREGNMALLEFRVEALNPGDVLRLNYHNKILSKGEMLIDDFLIRKEGEDVLVEEGGVKRLNNRVIRRDE